MTLSTVRLCWLHKSSIIVSQNSDDKRVTTLLEVAPTVSFLCSIETLRKKAVILSFALQLGPLTSCVNNTHQWHTTTTTTPRAASEDTAVDDPHAEVEIKPQLKPRGLTRAFLVAQLVKNHLKCGRPGFNPWVGKTPWRRERLPTPVFWSGEFQGPYRPWSRER